MVDPSPDLDRARRRHQLLQQALDLDPEQRADFLDTACDSDSTLRGEVESLLRGQDAAGSFLDAPVLDYGTVAPPSMVGRRVGRYEIKSVIATGGMGTVYLAIQDEPERTVALKMMRAELSSRSVLQRFLYESRVLARLKHPNIAQVYEAGMFEPDADRETRVPWFAMEHVESAVTITQYAQERRLGTRERLALFAPVCDAVHHGHQRGIVHRDLKPGNILVDGAGRPRVIDFGVARTTDADIALTTVRTDVGQLVGTLQYMSPEQCKADPADLDARSDVYSLGVVLYELLCEHLPYDVRSRPVFEAARVVREQVPVRPSTRDRTLRGDVETITLKALEKGRDRRYQSAADLQRDIERYLRFEPIDARPPSVSYRSRMFIRRHRAVTGAAAVIALALVATAIVSLTFAFRASRAESNALRVAYVASMAAAESEWIKNEYRGMGLHLERAPRKHRGWEWNLLARTAEPSLALLPHETNVKFVAYSPNGEHLATGTQDGVVHISEAATGAPVASWQAHERPIRCIAYDPRGARLMTVSEGGTMRFWKTGTWEPGGTIRTPDGQYQYALYTSDGTEIVSIDIEHDGRLRRWDSDTHAPLGSVEVPGARIWRVAVSADGERIATGQLDGTVRIYQAATLELQHVLQPVTLRIHDLQFSQDGTRLFSAHTGQVQIYDPIEGTSVGVLEQQGRAITLVVPDDPSVVIVGWGHVVRLWDLTTRSELRTLVGHTDEVQSLALSPDGRTLASGSVDATTRIWDIDPLSNLDELFGQEGQVTSVTLTPDGDLLATTSPDRAIRVWDVRAHTLLAKLDQTGFLFDACFSPDGHALAHTSSNGVILRDAATGAEIDRFTGHTEVVRTVRFAPGGRYLVSASADATARIWDLEHREPSRVLSGHEKPIHCLAVDAHGRRVATGGVDQTVRLWDLATGQALFTLPGHEATVNVLAFSPDGEVLASGGRDRRIRLWSVATGASIETLPSHGDSVASLTFHPDGSRLASARWYGGVAIWDTTDFEAIVALHVKRGRSPGVASFDPQGDRLVVGCIEGSIELWDERPGATRRAERRAALAQLESAEPVVTRMLAAHGDREAVAAALRSDTELAPARRAAALRVLLRRTHGPE